MVPGQEANSDNLGIFFSIFYKIIVCCVYSLESPRYNIQFHDTIRKKVPKYLFS